MPNCRPFGVIVITFSWPFVFQVSGCQMPMELWEKGLLEKRALSITMQTECFKSKKNPKMILHQSIISKNMCALISKFFKLVATILWRLVHEVNNYGPKTRSVVRVLSVINGNMISCKQWIRDHAVTCTVYTCMYGISHFWNLNDYQVRLNRDVGVAHVNTSIVAFW